VVVLRQLPEHVRGQLVAVVGHVEGDQVGRDVVEGGVADLQRTYTPQDTWSGYISGMRDKILHQQPVHLISFKD
jgi:hypothetical protein